MNGKKFTNNLILVLLVVGLGVAVYFFFFTEDDSAPGLTTSGGETAGTVAGLESQPNQEFLNILSSLESIKLETGIFSDPVFLGFKDFSQPLKKEPEGRPNPFKDYNPKAIWITPAGARATSTATSSTQ